MSNGMELMSLMPGTAARAYLPIQVIAADHDGAGHICCSICQYQIHAVSISFTGIPANPFSRGTGGRQRIPSRLRFASLRLH